MIAKTAPRYSWEEAQTEAHFMGLITDYARSCGWAYLHIAPGLNERGRYRTPVSGELGVGWPDLFLVRRTDRLAIEVKAQKGRVTPSQERVMELLTAAGIDCRVWRPSDWNEIADRLR